MRRPDGSMSKKDARFLAAHGVKPAPTKRATSFFDFTRPIEFTFTVDSTQFESTLDRLSYDRLTTYTTAATLSMKTVRDAMASMQAYTIPAGTYTVTTT